MGVWAKFGTPYLFQQPLKLLATTIWYTTWVWGVAHQETTFRSKIGRGLDSGLVEHPKKFRDSLLILQQLKLATSNSVHNLGLGSTLQ